MDPTKLADVMRTALPREKVMAFAREFKVVQRESVIDIVELVNALVLTSRSPAGGRQADVLRAYVDATRVEPVRGAFYARFNTQLEHLFERLTLESLAAAQNDPVLLPVGLQGVKDWLIFDSETVKLHRDLMPTYPGAGNYAALKVHKAFSLGRHNTIDYEISPARTHDSKCFKVTEALGGYGLLFDLGYASHDRLRDCLRHDVRFVVKLKTGWKARLKSVDVGEVRDLFEGTDFAEAIALGQLSFEDGVLDADVVLGSGRDAYPARLVAIETPSKGVCVFLTNLDRERHQPKLVADLYRLRWEIEKSNKLDKSDFCLEDLDCRKVCSARTMIIASLLGSSIVGRLIHADHCALAAERAKRKPMKHGPLHARLLAMAMAAFHVRITAAIEPSAPISDWDRIASGLDHLARDPNWRRRPSVLDSLYGFTTTPGRNRRQKAITSADNS